MTGEERILNICKEIPALEELYRARVRHYTIKEHTLNVYNQFEKYFSKRFSEIDMEFFKQLILLHDIGKPIASENRDRSNQQIETTNIISSHRQALNLSDENFLLLKALLGNDSLELYIQNKITLNTAYENISKQSQISGLEIKLFFYLLSVYYQCDIASYTVDAGGLKYLEYLFDYENGNKIYNSKTKLLKFNHKCPNK